MGFMDDMRHESSYSTASGQSYHYVVLQVTLKEKLFGTQPHGTRGRHQRPGGKGLPPPHHIHRERWQQGLRWR